MSWLRRVRERREARRIATEKLRQAYFPLRRGIVRFSNGKEFAYTDFDKADPYDLFLMRGTWIFAIEMDKQEIQVSISISDDYYQYVEKGEESPSWQVRFPKAFYRRDGTVDFSDGSVISGPWYTETDPQRLFARAFGALHYITASGGEE